MSLGTFRIDLPLSTALLNAQLVPQNVLMDFLVVTAASTGNTPEEQNVTIQIGFGSAQPQLYTTPVAFNAMRDRKTCEPFGEGITVTAPAIPGLVLIAQGGLS